MSQITPTFEALRKQGRKALVPFITAGDPQPDITVPLMHALVEAGADVVELGVPFSDPMADGPVIQRASERALKNNVNLRQVLQMVKEFRTKNTQIPVVLMGYLNPVEIMGYATFAKAAGAAGVDGVLTVDIPPEESAELSQALRDAHIDPIFLLAPTSTTERINLIAGAASGFVYYVSLRGVTGATHLDVAAVKDQLQAIRTRTTLPVGVGFGINSPETAAAVASVADAVVVGSALVNRIGDLAEEREKIMTDVPGFLATLRSAMDQVGAAA